MSEKEFIKKYLNDLSSLIIPDDEILEKLTKIKEVLLNTSKNNGKVMIFGNGGSAAISSHVSVDLTKNAKIKSLNFNEADLITCFSNDYGYERWIEKAIDFYAEENDSLIGTPVSLSNVVLASLKENGSSLSCNRDRSEANSSPIKSDLVANVWPNFMKLGPSFTSARAIRCPQRKLSCFLFRKQRAAFTNKSTSLSPLVPVAG